MWINATGAEVREDDGLNEKMLCLGMLIDGRARPTGVRQRGVEATMLLILNSYHDVVQLTLSAQIKGTAWRLLIDTSKSDYDDEVASEIGATHNVVGRSFLLFRLDS